MMRKMDKQPTNKITQMKLKGLLKVNELTVIETLQKELPAEAGDLYLVQLMAVDVVQRELGGNSLNFYSRRFFRTRPLDCEPFPNMPEEIIAATCSSQGNQKRKAIIWFVRGFPFCLEFDSSIDSNVKCSWTCKLNPEFEKLISNI